MKQHLEPLGIATNITQASFCHLDQVLLTFSHLIMQYKSMADPEDVVGCTAIIESIEACWATADQEYLLPPWFSIHFTKAVLLLHSNSWPMQESNPCSVIFGGTFTRPNHLLNYTNKLLAISTIQVFSVTLNLLVTLPK
jgi:hypothetical protein